MRLWIYTTPIAKLTPTQTGLFRLAYREAVNNLEHFEPVARTQKHYFLGFNALSKAEDALIQQLLECVAGGVWD